MLRHPSSRLTYRSSVLALPSSPSPWYTFLCNTLARSPAPLQRLIVRESAAVETLLELVEPFVDADANPLGVYAVLDVVLEGVVHHLAQLLPARPRVEGGRG